jgi:hypothetical protein
MVTDPYEGINPECPWWTGAPYPESPDDGLPPGFDLCLCCWYVRFADEIVGDMCQVCAATAEAAPKMLRCPGISDAVTREG